MNKHETKFYEALEDIFLGAKIEGEGGFVNLLSIKSAYYKKILKQFKTEVDKDPVVKQFKEEFFDRLYSFFEKYFSESGSVYFTKTRYSQNIYEKVYTDNKDVVLFWKTNVLYYVKSDILFQNIDVEVKDDDDFTYNFFFDCGELVSKQNNEKKELIFTHESTTNEKHNFSVAYSTHGRKNNLTQLSRSTKVPETVLDKAFNVFKKQNSVDFFINKDANRFLTEQLDLYLHQILIDESNQFDTDRLKQIKKVKEYSLKIISFIAQFENELVKIWNKPKFPLNSNYIITKNLLTDEMIEKLETHPGYKYQLEEWEMLNIDEEGDRVPFDTKHFKSIELELLSHFENLDDKLDGRLIRSENYQVLNTLQNRYKESTQSIYIDPPFNTGTDFIFVDNYQDSTWLNIIYDRVQAAYSWLKKDGSLYLHLDHIAEHYGRELLDDIFGKDNFKAKITWNTGDNISGFKAQAKNWIRQADYIHFYTKDSGNYYFTKCNEPLEEIPGLGWLDVLGNENNNRYIEVWENDKLIRKPIKQETKPKGTIWNDVYSFMYSEPRETESLSFVSNQKPENLLRRIIQSSTKPNDLVVDFFAGSGTTPAVAHKLGRKYLAVEMGEYFDETYFDIQDIKKEQLRNAIVEEVIQEKKSSSVVKIRKIGLLGRMKIVLNGDKEFYPTHSKLSRKPHLSKDVNWEGGGFIKYYDLEQYEDTLNKSKYSETATTIFDETNPFANYIFQSDDKLADVLEIEIPSNREAIVKLNFDKLYPNIDFAETISLIKGKKIRQITEKGVLLEGETKEINVDYKNMTPEQKVEFVKMLKPVLWWGE